MLENWGHDRSGEYAAFIWQAVTDPAIFANFRRDPRYVAVVETLWPETGQLYLDHIKDEGVRRLCLQSEAADKIGNPVTGTYDGARLAPTTLRYGKVLGDLVALFPHFAEIEEIVEIGIGHGGQARLITEHAALTRTRLRRYGLIDLAPVLQLAKSYLEHFPIRPQLAFLSRPELDPAARIGLAISNYAFSELGRALQEDYLERVLLRAEAGYLTMNTGLLRNEWRGRECLTAETLLQRLPGAALVEELPVTAPENYVIVFGRHAAGAGLSLDALRRAAEARKAAAPVKEKKRRSLLARLGAAGRR